MAQITLQLLRKLAPSADPGVLTQDLVKSMQEQCARFAINTPIRLAHFLAQAAHETDGFQTLEEYASGKQYEGRKDLGNTQPGDGVRFKGRGIFQLTGRSNYAFYGNLTGLQLVDNPKLAAQPAVAATVAALYWQRKGLNTWADRDDVVQITKRINGGTNGLANRRSYLRKAKALLGVAPVVNPTAAIPGSEETPEAPMTTISPKEQPWYKSWDIGSLAAAGLSAFGSALTGASGPIAFALAFAVVVFTILGAYFLIKRLRGV